MKEGVAGIIEDYDGMFLLHLRDGNAPTMKNQWCLIGGSVEEGEDIKQALVREIKEETALDAYDLNFANKFCFNNKNIHIYHGYIDTRKQKIILNEGKDLRFFEPEELEILFRKLSYSNPFLDSMKAYLKNR